VLVLSMRVRILSDRGSMILKTAFPTSMNSPLLLFTHPDASAHLLFNACTFSSFPCSQDGTRPASLASLFVYKGAFLTFRSDVVDEKDACIK